jgi:hypothetical protein
VSTSYISRHGVGSLAVLAAVVALLFGTGTDSAQQPSVQLQQPQGPREEAPRYLGDMPLPLPESKHVVLQTTPQELVASITAARARRDMAALARCCSTSAGRPALDQLDEVRAERDFFEGEQLMVRLERAAKARTLRVEQQEGRPRTEPDERVDATGMLVFPSGTQAITELQLPIVRIRGAWYVRVSP